MTIIFFYIVFYLSFDGLIYFHVTSHACSTKLGLKFCIRSYI
jgi:hypothetical protein